MFGKKKFYSAVVGTMRIGKRRNVPDETANKSLYQRKSRVDGHERKRRNVELEMRFKHLRNRKHQELFGKEKFEPFSDQRTMRNIKRKDVSNKTGVGAV